MEKQTDKPRPAVRMVMIETDLLYDLIAWTKFMDRRTLQSMVGPEAKRRYTVMCDRLTDMLDRIDEVENETATDAVAPMTASPET